jgi:hypothetical protein
MSKHTRSRTGRFALSVVAVVAASAVGLLPAGASNFPHFKSFSVTTTGGTTAAAHTAAAKATPSTGSAALPDLLYTWVEVGVGNPDVTYQLSSVVTATFGCVNNGQNPPQAGNKMTMTRPVSSGATLTADKNGRIAGSVVLNTSDVSPTGFSCPPGQDLTALSAKFTQNTITDTTDPAHPVSATAPDISVQLWP